MFERYLFLSLFSCTLRRWMGRWMGRYGGCFPLPIRPKLTGLSDERTLGLDLGDKNSPNLRPTS